jgi:putative spermidine/putrescine transport system ATP-binding protein
LYNKPATEFVGTFVGTMNHLHTKLSDGKINLFGQSLDAMKSGNESGNVIALIRPEAITVKTDGEANATVVTRSFLGASSRVTCRTLDGTLVEALMTSAATGDLHPGSQVQLQVLSKEVLVTNV